jgi:hypothetical protein
MQAQAIGFKIDVLDAVIHILKRYKMNTKTHHFKIIMMSLDKENVGKKQSIRNIFSENFTKKIIDFFNWEYLYAR